MVIREAGLRKQKLCALRNINIIESYINIVILSNAKDLLFLFAAGLPSPRSESRLLSPSIHCLVRQPIRSLVVFPQRMTDFEMLKAPDQLLRLLVKLAQFRMTHLVDALHLPHHQFGIADHVERLDLVFGGVTERRNQPLILRIVVGMVSQVFAKLGDRMPRGILNSNPVSCRPRIAASSAIDVRSVRGNRGFRQRSGRREKIARLGRT